jgi:hypothetical protein
MERLTLSMPEFENTFAPNVKKKMLTVDEIIQLLFHRVVLYQDLPPAVKNFVDREIQSKTK